MKNIEENKIKLIEKSKIKVSPNPKNSNWIIDSFIEYTILHKNNYI